MTSAAKIAGYAHVAGWRGRDQAVAVAVALAESGGSETKLGDRGRVGERTADGRHWGPSVGLWQIRSVQEESGKGSLRDQRANSNGQTNANHAYAIWKQNGWGPWTTHNSGAYLLWMPTALAAVNLNYAANPSEVVGDAAGVASRPLEPVLQLAGTVSDAVQTPVRIAKWLTEGGTWLRIAYLVTGGVLVALGVAGMVRGPAQKAATQVAGLVMPAGKAVKAVKGMKGAGT